MVASYPGTPTTFTTKVDLRDPVYAEHVNSVQDEVLALQTTLGLNPHIGTTPNPAGRFVSAPTDPWSSVSARLANIELGIVADTHTQYMKKSGGEVIQAGLATTVGLRIRGASGQSAALLQFLNPAGAEVAAFTADGSLSVNNLTVNGTQTNLAGSATALDLGSTTGIAASTGANVGDKIQLYRSDYGLGVQSNRMVAWVPANAGFAVRLKSGSGYASSGSDAIVLNSDGTALFTGLASLLGGLDVSGAGGTLASAGTTVGDKLGFYANTGFGVTDATHLSLFVNGANNVFQIAPANTGTGAKSSGITPGVQLTGGGIANFKTDARINNVPMPRGILDSGQRTTNSGGITTTTMMTEFRADFTAVAGHYYRVTLTAKMAGASNDSFVYYALHDGTTTGSPTLNDAVVRADITFGFGVITKTLVWMVTGLSAGAHTLMPSIAPYPSGTVYNMGGTGSAGQFFVEDMGALAQTAL